MAPKAWTSTQQENLFMAPLALGGQDTDLEQVSIKITSLQLHRRLEALMKEIKSELEKPQDHQVTRGGISTNSNGLLSDNPVSRWQRPYTSCSSKATPSPGSFSFSKDNHHHVVLHGNVLESKHLESTIKMIEKERREVVRQYNVLKALEKRKLQKIVTQVASRVCAARKLRRSSDRSPVAIAPPPSPIATSTPATGTSHGIHVAIRRIAPPSPRSPQYRRGNQHEQKNNAVSEDKMAATPANLPSPIDFQEAKQNTDNSSDLLTQAVVGEEESLQERRRLVKPGQKIPRQSLTLPRLYLLPRGSLNCDRLSQDAIDQLENSKEKPPVRRRLFGVDVTNTRLASR